MWLTCRFLLRNFKWEKRIEFFVKYDEDSINKAMSQYLWQNYHLYAGVIVCNEDEVLCAIVQ